MTALAIHEVAEQTGLSAHTLRYYERAGLLLPIERAPSGHRRYSDGDVKAIQFLTKLRSAGMPVADIQRYVELAQLGERKFHVLLFAGEKIPTLAGAEFLRIFFEPGWCINGWIHAYRDDIDVPA